MNTYASLFRLTLTLFFFLFLVLLTLFLISLEKYPEAGRFTGVFYEENLCYARKEDIADFIKQIKNDDIKKIFLLGDSTVWGYGLKNDETLAKKLAEGSPSLHVYNLGACGAKPLDYLLLSSLALQNSATAKDDQFFVFFHPKWFSKKYNDRQQSDHFFTQTNVSSFFPNYQHASIGSLIQKINPEISWKKRTTEDYLAGFFESQIPLFRERNLFFYEILGAKSPGDFFAKMSDVSRLTEARIGTGEQDALFAEKPQTQKNYNFEYAQKHWSEKDFSSYNCQIELGSEKWVMSGEYTNYNLIFAKELDNFFKKFHVPVKYFLPPINPKLTKDCLKTNEFTANRALLERTFDVYDFLEGISAEYFLDDSHLNPEGTEIFSQNILASITGEINTLYLLYDKADAEDYTFDHELQDLLAKYDKRYTIKRIQELREISELKKDDLVISVLFGSQFPASSQNPKTHYYFFYPTPKDEAEQQNKEKHIYSLKNTLPAQRFFGETPDDLGKKVIASAVMRRLFPNLLWKHRLGEGQLIEEGYYITEKQELERIKGMLAADPQKKIIILGDSILQMMDLFHYEYMSEYLEQYLPEKMGEEYSVYNLSFSGAKHLDRLVLLTYLEDVLSKEDIVIVNVNYSWLFLDPEYTQEMRSAYALQHTKRGKSIFSEFDLTSDLTKEIEEFSKKYSEYNDRQDYVLDYVFDADEEKREREKAEAEKIKTEEISPEEEIEFFELPEEKTRGEENFEATIPAPQKPKDNCSLGGYNTEKLDSQGDQIRILKALSRELRKYDSYVFFSPRRQKDIQNCMTSEYYYNNALINQIFADMGDQYVNLMSTLPDHLYMDATHYNRDGAAYMSDFLSKFLAGDFDMPSENGKIEMPETEIPKSNIQIIETEIYSTGEGYGKNSVYLAYEREEDRVTIYLQTGNNPKDIAIQKASAVLILEQKGQETAMVIEKEMGKALSANMKYFFGEVVGERIEINSVRVNERDVAVNAFIQ